MTNEAVTRQENNVNDFSEGTEIQSTSVESGTVALLNKSEIDQQITTARRYPRSITKFRQETLQMVTLSEIIAQECIYALPRDGKVIEGPSARFAEIVASAWGNCRAGARVVNEGADFVTSQGVFHDLERNVAITYEVQRRITTSKGKRYSPDMIGVTANAGCSVALRNAILKGVPKAFWSEMYTAARKIVAGDAKTLVNKRAEAIKAFQIFGVTEEQILALLKRDGVQDIGLDDLVVLHGVLTAIREGDTTAEQAFAQEKAGIKMPQAKEETIDTATGEVTQMEDGAESNRQADGIPGTGDAVVRAGEPTKPLKTTQGGELATPGMLRVIRSKMTTGALSDTDLEAKFGVKFDQITKAMANAVIDWSQNPLGQ